ncbi:hypothetical protein KO529_22420 [Arenibacter algicola]|uniref:hypothetical protein n=1 Tax=Arenibacter algicola TaxID=616991 RepID=UPI001C07DB72|nr:hypothetical protein [Arenibacter algicola]MBU2907574.1 hypothetical protein [Arenibacter algicola]
MVKVELISIIKAWAEERIWFLITIIVFVILVATPLARITAFLPDYLNLSQVNSKEYFGLIIGAIASIFGILMAVIIITLEFFKERLNKNEHVNPLENKLIRNSIYNSVNLIGLSFIAYIFVDSFNTAKSLTIGYFLGIMFIAYIYSVFPVLKNIIGKSSQIKNNIDLTNTLILNSFKTASRYRHNKPEETNEVLKTLKKELDSYILSNNVSSYEKINTDILSKALILISNGQDRNSCDVIISGLVWLWRENCKTAIRVNDNQYFELVWNYLKDVYVYFANKKAPLLHLQDLHFFIIFDFLKLHIKLGNSIPLSTALDCIEISFKANLNNNCPKQEDIRDLVEMYEGVNFEGNVFYNDTQWDEIISINGCLSRIQETAIKIGDKDAFEESSRRIQNVCAELNFHVSSLGNYQKGIITLQSLTASFSNSHDALKSGMYESTLDCLNIPKYLIKRLIEEENIDNRDIRIIIQTLADYIILAFKEKKLFMNKTYGTLNDFCMIGIYSLKYYKENSIAKQTVKYIIKVLRHLKELAEEDMSTINSNDYLAIKSRIKHFADVAERCDWNNECEKPVKKWRKIQNDFKNVSEDIDFGIVKWKLNNKIK